MSKEINLLFQINDIVEFVDGSIGTVKKINGDKIEVLFNGENKTYIIMSKSLKKYNGFNR